jgi:dTDP-4-dehydrorhamnose reductase
VILAFGGSGQLGQELVHASTAQGVPLAAVSRAEADVTDAASLRAAIARHKPSVVVNGAAYTKVDLAETETEAARAGNETGPACLAVACAQAGVPLIHLSTDYVFDGSKAEPYVETDPIAPIGAYGCSKAAGEAAVREAMPQHIIIRTSWVYGVFGANFLKTMLGLAARQDELRIVADQRGCPTSSAELAGAIVAIAPRLAAREGVWGTYHFAGDGVTTWHGFASRVVAAQAPLTGRSPRVTPIATAERPTAARRPVNSALDSGKFARVFGIRARPWGEEVDRVTRTLVSAQQGKPEHVA